MRERDDQRHARGRGDDFHARIAENGIAQPRHERMASALPSASPAMNAPTTIAADHTAFPTTSPACANHTVSKASAPAPERKNMP
jgi:hypothetical protein